MAVGDYLKVASANLRNAAAAMQHDIANLRNEITKMEQNARRQIDDIRQEINRNNTRAGTSSNGDERAKALSENVRLNATIADIEHDIVRKKDEMNQNITNMERQAGALDREAGQLQGMS